jgi:hypothetical protein
MDGESAGVAIVEGEGEADRVGEPRCDAVVSEVSSAISANGVDLLQQHRVR